MAGPRTPASLPAGVRAAGLLLLLLTTACVQIFRKSVEVEFLDKPAAPRVQSVSSAVRAHMLDHSIVYFDDGVLATSDTLRGRGQWYTATLENLGARNSVPLDSVVGFEALHGGQVLKAASFFTSVLATGLAAAGTAALLVAIFGSCPTIYSPHLDAFTLEAEGFSYSISPMLEARDVDLIRRPAIRDGVLELEVRNEALETHYLNHLEVMAVELSAGERALPDETGKATAFQPHAAVLPATDRAGRNVSDVVAAADGQAFSSDPVVLRDAVSGDPFERLELELPALPGESEAGLVLRLRNSLLTSLLFYDVMLAPAGLTAVDWLTRDVERIGSALEIGRWTLDYLGLRVEVQGESGELTPLARVSDVGPIAWEEMVVRVPVRQDRTTRVRISFLADAWRIDRIGLATELREPVVTPLPIREVRGADGRAEVEARGALQRVDQQYLETRPGQRVTIHFEVPESDRPIGFLLASQGYYTEWIRTEWVRQAREPRTFEPSREVVSELLTRWISEKASFEERFFSSAIPVR